MVFTCDFPSCHTAFSHCDRVLELELLLYFTNVACALENKQQIIGSFIAIIATYIHAGKEEGNNKLKFTIVVYVCEWFLYLILQIVECPVSMFSSHAYPGPLQLLHASHPFVPVRQHPAWLISIHIVFNHYQRNYIIWNEVLL